jgi:hypothetical protein
MSVAAKKMGKHVAMADQYARAADHAYSVLMGRAIPTREDYEAVTMKIGLANMHTRLAELYSQAVT